MPTQPIVINGNTITLVSLPTSPGLRSVEWKFLTTSAVVTSIFTGEQQAQKWPGGDFWSGTVTLPPLTQDQADAWLSALMQCQGVVNAIQVGDPMKQRPKGLLLGTPAVDGSVAVTAGTNILATKGWQVSRSRQLIAGDFIQVGFRLHRVLDVVNSDANGKALINVWPSLREVPPDGQPLVTQSPKGLFRLANQQNGWSSDYTRLTALSFQISEYR